jgi:hypothetical protein
MASVGRRSNKPQRPLSRKLRPRQKVYVLAGVVWAEKDLMDALIRIKEPHENIHIGHFRTLVTPAYR